MKSISSYLHLGPVGVKVGFSNKTLAEAAHNYSFLKDILPDKIISEITFTVDDDLSSRYPIKGISNAVFIRHEETGLNQSRIILYLYDRYCFEIQLDHDRICILHESDAPVRITLDDVFHGALQKVLEKIGGFILHGSCVVKNGEAIVFIGKSGSGKSTVAFNLALSGYQPYADDSVIVTLKNKALWVWPLIREFSIRPLSFRLFRDQNIELERYVKEGEKYYFSFQKSMDQPASGAILRHIFFVETSGEKTTSIRPLDSSEARKQFSGEQKYFSFMARDSSGQYSRTVLERVPFFHHISLGIDLDAQRNAIEAAVSGYVMKVDSSTLLPTRTQKLEIIRRAWFSPVSASARQIIPFLADYDLKIFTLALSFFQTLPLAKLTVLNPHDHYNNLQETCPARWLHCSSWLTGCCELVQNTDLEVIERYGVSWMKSAPLLYPFLVMASRINDAKRRKIQEAWMACSRDLELRRTGETGTEIHVMCSDIEKMEVFEKGSELFDSVSPDLPVRLVIWIFESDSSRWPKTVRRLCSSPLELKIILVPVVRNVMQNIQYPLSLIRTARESGLIIRLTRMIPLCRLREKDAAYLIETGSFEMSLPPKPARRFVLVRGTHSWKPTPIFDVEKPRSFCDSQVSWKEPMIRDCKSCGLNLLRLCMKGIFICK